MRKRVAAPAEVRARVSPCSARCQSCAAGSRCSRNGLTRTNAAALSALRQPHVASRPHQASQRASSASDSPARIAGKAHRAHSDTGEDTAARGSRGPGAGVQRRRAGVRAWHPRGFDQGNKVAASSAMARCASASSVTARQTATSQVRRVVEGQRHEALPGAGLQVIRAVCVCTSG